MLVCWTRTFPLRADNWRNNVNVSTSESNASGEVVIATIGNYSSALLAPLSFRFLVSESSCLDQALQRSCTDLAVFHSCLARLCVFVKGKVAENEKR